MSKAKCKVLKNFSYEQKRKEGDKFVKDIIEVRRWQKCEKSGLFIVDKEGYKKPKFIELSGDSLKFALKIKAVEVVE